MRVSAIANQKDGVANTATASNLATLLCQKKTTLRVDLDPQGHCAQTLTLDASKLSPTIYDVLFGRTDARDAIRRLRDNTLLLPANRELAIGEVELRDSFRRDERLKQVLETLRYDYVILDCPPPT